jgi:hypothetical protein
MSIILPICKSVATEVIDMVEDAVAIRFRYWSILAVELKDIEEFDVNSLVLKADAVVVNRIFLFAVINLFLNIAAVVLNATLLVAVANLFLNADVELEKVTFELAAAW